MSDTPDIYEAVVALIDAAREQSDARAHFNRELSGLCTPKAVVESARARLSNASAALVDAQMAALAAARRVSEVPQ